MAAASLAACDRGLPLKWDAFRLRPALLLCIAALRAAAISMAPRSDGMYRQGWQVPPGYMWHLCSLMPERDRQK